MRKDEVFIRAEHDESYADYERYLIGFGSDGAARVEMVSRDLDGMDGKPFFALALHHEPDGSETYEASSPGFETLREALNWLKQDRLTALGG
jgi:hypothetical protein